MAINTVTSLTDQYQRHFSKELLDYAKQELKLNQFGSKRKLPQRLGATTIRFFARMPVTKATVANVQTLVEGVPISTFTTYTYTKVDVNLVQLGEALQYTDIVGWTALLEVLEDGIAYLGENFALKADEMTWAACAHPTTGLTKRYSGGAANYNALVALSNSAGKYLSKDGLAAVTQLRLNRAPRKNGAYMGIVGPRIAFDLKRDTEWLNAKSYSDVKGLFMGEIGELDGIRYVETTNAWGEDNTNGTEGTQDTASPEIHSSIFTGADAYGVVELSGHGPNAPKVVIVDQPDHADYLGQIKSCGVSAYYASAVLQAAHGIIVRSKSTFA